MDTTMFTKLWWQRFTVFGKLVFFSGDFKIANCAWHRYNWNPINKCVSSKKPDIIETRQERLNNGCPWHTHDYVIDYEWWRASVAKFRENHLICDRNLLPYLLSSDQNERLLVFVKYESVSLYSRLVEECST